MNCFKCWLKAIGVIIGSWCLVLAALNFQLLFSGAIQGRNNFEPQSIGEMNILMVLIPAFGGYWMNHFSARQATGGTMLGKWICFILVVLLVFNPFAKIVQGGAGVNLWAYSISLLLGNLISVLYNYKTTNS